MIWDIAVWGTSNMGEIEVVVGEIWGPKETCDPLHPSSIPDDRCNDTRPHRTFVTAR